METSDQVWLCSGQSNMVWPFAWMPESVRPRQRALLGDGPLQVARVPDRASIDRDKPFPPLKWENKPGDELPALPAFLSSFLNRETGRSHGMVVSAIGGTRISSWIPLERFGGDPVLAQDAALHPHEDSEVHAAAHLAWQKERYAFDEANRVRESRGGNPVPYPREMFQGPPGPRSLFFPGGAFAAMIRPLKDQPFRGVVWYQGESDAETPEGYAGRLRLLVQCWRETFQNPNLPFVIVGLPKFTGDEHAKNWPHIRQQQRQVAEDTPGVKYVDTADLGEADNLHPSDKSAVAERILPSLLNLLKSP